MTKKTIVRTLAAVGAVWVTSGCLVMSGPEGQVTSFDFADPAAVDVGFGLNQLYATRSRGTRPRADCKDWMNVPSITVQASTGQQTVTMPPLHDALPTLPSWNVKNDADRAQSCTDPGVLVWAPTVRAVAGRWLMMWGGSRKVGSMCIGAATSSNPATAFTPQSFSWCDTNAAVGWLDPQLYVEGSNVWLTWSRQWKKPDGCMDSEIVIQPLSSNGLAMTGSRQQLVSFDSVKNLGGTFGCASVVENPQLVKDPYNGYDLLLSVGTWYDQTYRTIEVPCINFVNNCYTQYGGSLLTTDTGANPPHNAPGGMSSSRDDTNGRLYWHESWFGARITKSNASGFINLNCAKAGIGC